MLLMTNLISPKKKTEFFFLSCLLTFWNMLIQYPAKTLVWTQQPTGSFPRTMLVFAAENTEDFRGKTGWKICKSDAARRSKLQERVCLEVTNYSWIPNSGSALLPVAWSSKALGAWALIIKMWGLQAEEDHPRMVQKPACLKPRATWTRAPSDMIGVGRDFIVFLISVFPSVYLNTQQLN